MTSPHVEDVVYAAWRAGYREGWTEGWDRGLDQAVAMLRGRAAGEVLAELAELAGSAPEPTKYPDTDS